MGVCNVAEVQFMFSLVGCTSGIIGLRIHCQIQGQEGLSLYFPQSFMILPLTFRLLIDFELIFACGLRWGFSESVEQGHA